MLDTFAVVCAKYFYIIAALIAAVYFFTRPKRIMKGMAVCAVIVAPVAFILSRIASLLYYDPRPFVVGHFTPLIAHAADNGFPSDHVLFTGAIAMIVWFYNRKLSIVLWALAILIGWSRVFAGVHHSADIAGSIVIVIIAGLIYRFTVGRKTA